MLNTSTRARIADLAFTSTVLAVRLNRACLVVVEERRAVVHDLSTLAVQRVIDTPPNPRGVVALASDPDASARAVPSAADSGVVHVHDCVNHHVACEVRAHDSPIAALALTPNGRMLATASEKGTVVRVHVLPAARLCYHVSAWRRARERANPRVRTARGGRHGLRVPSVSLHGQGHRARVPRGGRAAAEGRARTRGGRDVRGGADGDGGGGVFRRRRRRQSDGRDAFQTRRRDGSSSTSDGSSRGGCRRARRGGRGGRLRARDATSADARKSSSGVGLPARDANRRGR